MPDYAALARQFGAVSSNTSSGTDYAALAKQFGGASDSRRPVSAEDFTTDTQPQGSVVGRFLSNAGEMLNPITMVKGIGQAVAHPIATGEALVGSQLEQFKKAKDLYGQGRYQEAAGYGLAGALPMLGPAAAAAGEQIASGDVAGGIGKGIGLLAPAAIGSVAPKGVRAGALKVNPDTAAAVAYAEKAGIPLDVAAATDNKFAQALQHVTDRSLAGSFVADKAAKVQAGRLATVGEQLAAKAHPVPVSAGQAGEAAQAGVGKVVTGQRLLANDAYDRLRAIEAQPEHAVTFQPEAAVVNPDAPYHFSPKAKASPDDIFSEALKDARANGYTGKVSDLREQFNQRLDSAKELKASTAEGDEYSHAALMKEIRDRGGLRPFDKDFQGGGPARQLREESQAASAGTRNYYGKNAVMRNDGLAVDDMTQQLSEDPKWGAVITPDTDLRDVVASGKVPMKPGADIQNYLRGVGVHPGATWWKAGAPAETVPLPVDVASVKDAMRPIAERLAAKKNVVGALMGQEATVAAKLDALIKGPDAVPLSVADAVLSDLKRMARSNHPDLRSVGQGIAAKAVSELHGMVSQAAERAGPDAVAALEEGRIATKAKYAAADVLKRLEGQNRQKSGATAFRGLTQAGDTSIGQLRDVIAQSPDTKPLIARAVLDRLIDHPTAGPAKTFTDWQKLGPETKYELFTPEHVKDLDQFFALRKRLAANPNPSGTAHNLLTVSQVGHLVVNPASGVAAQIGAGVLAKLLHSPKTVRLLTRGMTIPVKATAASTAWLADLAAATSPSESQPSTASATAR